MSWKSCYWHEKNDTYMAIYSNLYCEVDKWCMENLKDEDLEYYIKITD